MVLRNANTLRWEETNEPFPNCSQGWLYDSDQSSNTTTDGETIIVYQVPPPVDLNQLDPTVGGALWAAGFSLSFAPFFAAFAIRQILSLIR